MELCSHASTTVDRVSQHVEHSTKRRGSDGDGDRATGVDDGQAAPQAGRAPHSNATDGVRVDMLLNLNDEIGPVVTLHDQGIMDTGKVARGEHCIHNDADNTCQESGCWQSHLARESPETHTRLPGGMRHHTGCAHPVQPTADRPPAGAAAVVYQTTRRAQALAIQDRAIQDRAIQDRAIPGSWMVVALWTKLAFRVSSDRCLRRR